MSDEFDHPEITAEDDPDSDIRVKLSYSERTGAKDRITVNVYHGDEFTGYHFNVADRDMKECYYDSSVGDPRPSVSALRALAENEWTVTNFSIEELQEAEREDAHLTLSDIFEKHEKMLYGISRNALADPDDGKDVPAELMLDASNPIVQRLALEAAARTQLLRYIIDAEREAGKPFSEMDVETDIGQTVLNKMQYHDPDQRIELLELFGALVGETTEMDQMGVEGLPYGDEAIDALERGFERGKQRRTDDE